MKKGKLILSLVSGLILLAFSATSGFPYPVDEGDWLIFRRVGTVGGSDGGGEFSVHDGNTDIKLFESFCIERDEYITLGTKYLVGYITTNAIEGGKNPTPSPDPLDPKTAYLFYKYSTNSLNGYVDDPQHANALQEVIWYIEGEYYPDIHILSAIAQQFYDDAAGNAESSLWGVKVLNMYKGYDTRGVPIGFVQDQLVYQPTPEPGTLLLVGAGLIGLGAKFRRRKK